MTPQTLRKELDRSLRRRGMDPLSEPYKKPPRTWSLPENLGTTAAVPARRTTNCVGCGKRMKSKAKDLTKAQCLDCLKVCTPELGAQVAAMRERGMFFREIARELGVSFETTMTALKLYETQAGD